ncbi:MAG: rod shape-determining protein [Myxococcota bacterium]|nr:rod shape-determining protein [Myxococcota bacterium]
MSSLFEHTLGLLTPELSIDFGHDRLRMASQDLSNQIDEASLIILKTNGKQSVLYASGNPARNMQGRMGSQYQAQRPLFDNELKDTPHTQNFLTSNIRRVLGGKSLFQPRTIVATPHRMNTEQLALFSKLLQPTCGKDLYFIPSLLCAALGANINYELPSAHLIMDIGHSSTRIAAVSLSCILSYAESPIGGHYLNRLIIRYFHQQHGIHIDSLGAEDIKINTASAYFPSPNLQLDCVGRESDGKGTKRVTFFHSDIFQLLQTPFKEWSALIRKVCGELHPAAFEDITQHPIRLIGGGSQINGLDTFLSEQTGLNVECTEFPRECILKGAQLFHRNHNLLLWSALPPAA